MTKMLCNVAKNYLDSPLSSSVEKAFIVLKIYIFFAVVMNGENRIDVQSQDNVYKFFLFLNKRLNNNSIFNPLLYFLCCQTFSAALVNAFNECIQNVYTHFKVKHMSNFSFLRVFLCFTHMNCQVILQI